MATSYDAIVIGAGHNGLTCACYLARAGLKVLVLEQYSTPGGMTISDEIVGPGLLSDIHASGYLVAKLTPAPGELELARHGLELITPDPNWAQVYPSGECLLVGRDVETTVASIARFSPDDGEAWRRLYQRYCAAKPDIVASMNAAPVQLAVEYQRPAAVDAYRFQMQSARSWVNETFKAQQTRTFFAVSRASRGAFARRRARRILRLALRQRDTGCGRQYRQRRHAPRLAGAGGGLEGA